MKTFSIIKELNEPLLHGTNRKFSLEELRPSRGGHVGPGVYMTQDQTSARNFGEYILKAKPKKIAILDLFEDDKDMLDAAKKLGIAKEVKEEMKTRLRGDPSRSRFYLLQDCLLEKLQLDPRPIGVERAQTLIDALKKAGYTGIRYAWNTEPAFNIFDPKDLVAASVEAAPSSFLPDKLVMVDCEMTGVDETEHELLQAAFVKLELQDGQYVEAGEPLVLYFKHSGAPQNDFHKKYLTHIFEKCNDSDLTGEQGRAMLEEWLGDWVGEVEPTGDCVHTDLAFLKHNGVVKRNNIVDDEQVPGTFHYESFELNPLKAFSRHKAGEKYTVADIDEENVHDALVDCRNQTKELNSYIEKLLPDYVQHAKANADEHLPDTVETSITESSFADFKKDYLDVGNAEGFLDAWLSQARDSRSEEEIGDLISATGEENEEEREQLMLDWINDTTDDQLSRMKKHMKFKGDRLIVYRKIKVNDIDMIDTEHLGIYWTYKVSTAVAYWGHGEHDVLVRATISLDDVDFPSTLMAHTHTAHFDEDEITLKEGAQLKDVEMIENKKTVRKEKEAAARIEAAAKEVSWEDAFKEFSRVEHIKEGYKFPDNWTPDKDDDNGLLPKRQTHFKKFKWERDPAFSLTKPTIHGNPLTDPMWSEGYDKPTEPWDLKKYEALEAKEDKRDKLTSKESKYLSGWSDEYQARQYAKLKTKAPPVFVIWDEEEKRYRFWNGRHRSRAAALRGDKTIDAYVGLPIENVQRIGASMKRRIHAADEIRPEDLPIAVQPVEVDDGVLPDEKREIVVQFQRKALRADSFQDFQELLNQVMLDAQLTEEFRPSVAGILNEYRIEEGYVAL